MTFSFRYTSGVCKHKKMILSYRMGQKLSSKLLYIMFTKLMVFTDIFHIADETHIYATPGV